MFTGIVRGTYEVVDTSLDGTLLTYVVHLDDALVEGLAIGASVAIDGVCQTVVRVDGVDVTFDAIAETLQRTTLGELHTGRTVNVERSYRIGDELGGHEVAGHVMGTGQVLQIVEGDGTYDLQLAVPAGWSGYIMEKGFIAVDGSSLTVGRLGRHDTTGDATFWLHLIPETLRLTRLGDKAVGERVNIELDARTVTIVDTVERVLAERERRTGGG